MNGASDWVARLPPLQRPSCCYKLFFPFYTQSIARQSFHARSLIILDRSQFRGNQSCWNPTGCFFISPVCPSFFFFFSRVMVRATNVDRSTQRRFLYTANIFFFWPAVCVCVHFSWKSHRLKTLSCVDLVIFRRVPGRTRVKHSSAVLLIKIGSAKKKKKTRLGRRPPSRQLSVRCP